MQGKLSERGEWLQKISRNLKLLYYATRPCCLSEYFYTKWTTTTSRYMVFRLIVILSHSLPLRQNSNLLLNEQLPLTCCYPNSFTSVSYANITTFKDITFHALKTFSAFSHPMALFQEQVYNTYTASFTPKTVLFQEELKPTLTIECRKTSCDVGTMPR